MWYETLPSLAIMGMCLTMPQILIYFTHQLFLGTPYKRFIGSRSDRQLFLRDMRISGVNNAYKQIGLDSFPKEEDESKKKKK